VSVRCVSWSRYDSQHEAAAQYTMKVDITTQADTAMVCFLSKCSSFRGDYRWCVHVAKQDVLLRCLLLIVPVGSAVAS
jgi:hypothetical protein